MDLPGFFGTAVVNHEKIHSWRAGGAPNSARSWPPNLREVFPTTDDGRGHDKFENDLASWKTDVSEMLSNLGDRGNSKIF